MTHSIEHWEAVSLPGNYTLEQWLGGDDRAAFFQASIAPDGRRAIVKLVPETAIDGAATLDLWYRTHQLRHPNLVELLECGRATHGSEIVLYAAFEAPDDTLAAALSRSTLNELETREVLDSILGALRYLHAQGLVLGALDPSRIVAVGDRVKLSTDALREADTSSAYREDVRLLGELWQQLLMPAAANSAEIAAHAVDPNPESRWTLAEISAALEPPVITAPPPASPLIVSLPGSEPPAPVSPVSVPVPPTVVNQAHIAPPARRLARERATPYRFPRWIFFGAAGFLLLILVLNWRRPADATAQSRGSSVSPRVDTPVVVPAPAPAPSPQTAVPKRTVPTTPTPSPAPAGREMWRVIAFTYRTRDAAARKVQQLNQDHPGINAAIFSPEDKRGYYLVSLGGRMTHEEALRLQRTARGKGLPRDLYVQNYLR